MFPLLRSAINAIRRYPVTLNLTSSFHILSQPIKETQLLPPVVLNLIPNCGFKVKGKPKRRCKDCYMVWRQQRLFVLCKTHRRHKQMSVIKDPKNTWMLSHATQGKVRPW